MAETSTSKKVGRWIPLSLLAVATVVLFSLGLVWPDMGVREDARCFGQPAEKVDPVWAYYDRPNARPTDVEPGDPVQLSLVPDQSTTLHFGRSESVRSFDIDYTLAVAGGDTSLDRGQVLTLADRLGRSPLQVDLLQFRRADGAYLDPERVRARARVIGDRVRVTVCVDRRHAEALGDPGNYRGTVSIIDPRVARVDLPLDLDAADPDWALALGLVGVALIAGSWVTWVVKEGKSDDDEFKVTEWTGWTVTAIGLISLVAGGAAAVAVYQASYLGNATWGQSVGDSVTLLTGSFVAFMGATTSLHVASLAQRYREERQGTDAADRLGQGPDAGTPGSGTPSTD